MIGSGSSLASKWQTNSCLEAPPLRYSMVGLMNQTPTWSLVLDQPKAGILYWTAVVTVFVLDGIFIKAGAQNPLFLGVD